MPFTDQQMTVPVCACTRGLDEVHAPVQVCSLKKVCCTIIEHYMQRQS